MSEIRETLLETILSEGSVDLSQDQKSKLTDDKMEQYVSKYVRTHKFFSIRACAYDYFQFELGINRGHKDLTFVDLKKALCYKFKTYFKRLKNRGIITKYNKHTYMRIDDT